MKQTVLAHGQFMDTVCIFQFTVDRFRKKTGARYALIESYRIDFFALSKNGVRQDNVLCYIRK